MLTGPQIQCVACEWSNLTVRRRCRNCGTPLPPTEHNQDEPPRGAGEGE